MLTAGSILIVEDDPFTQAYHRACLGTLATVTTCSDGAEALEHLRSGRRFDLIVTDNEMPRVSGLELIERIRSDRSYHSKIPILLVTATTINSEKHRVEAQVIRKPVSSSELISAAQPFLPAP